MERNDEEKTRSTSRRPSGYEPSQRVPESHRSGNGLGQAVELIEDMMREIEEMKKREAGG